MFKKAFLDVINPPLNLLHRRGHFLKKIWEIDFRILPLNIRGDRGGRFLGLFIVLALITSISCSRNPEPLEVQFSATVAVADSIDQTSDYSGFQFLVFNRVSVNDPIDTLFFGATDSTGFLQGIIPFEQTGAYPVQLSRNGRNLATFRFLLADDDTITFSAEFPDLNETLEIDSRENRAMEVYNRVEDSYNRVTAFIKAGQVPAEEIPFEMRKFADLYWEVYLDKKGTFASKFSLEKAVTILNELDRADMFRKINQAFDEEYAFGLALTLGKDYVASTQGFDAAVSYLDSVRTLTKKDDIKKVVEQASIELHLDSLYVDKAKSLLTRFERNYEDEDDYSFWYKNLRFELYELTPGLPVPEFEFATADGDTVNNQSLLGRPYVLEFTLMANQLYQQQYDESTVIYQIYGPQGLQYFTIPFDESVNTIIGFYEERDRFWGVADPPSFDRKKMVDEFNIQFYPTRVLVDSEGNMVRKYIGEEFEGIIPGITETLIN